MLRGVKTDELTMAVAGATMMTGTTTGAEPARGDFCLS